MSRVGLLVYGELSKRKLVLLHEKAKYSAGRANMNSVLIVTEAEDSALGST